MKLYKTPHTKKGPTYMWETRAPKKRSSSYRDPDLSDKWIKEAEFRALNDKSLQFGSDSRKIILRLVRELRKVNKETGR